MGRVRAECEKTDREDCYCTIMRRLRTRWTTSTLLLWLFFCFCFCLLSSRFSLAVRTNHGRLLLGHQLHPSRHAEPVARCRRHNRVRRATCPLMCANAHIPQAVSPGSRLAG